MHYALVEEGVVTNLIWLYDHNASDFPNAVKLGELPVSVGDTYQDGAFFRDGQQVQTLLAQTEQYANALSVHYVELLSQMLEGGQACS